MQTRICVASKKHMIIVLILRNAMLLPLQMLEPAMNSMLSCSALLEHLSTYLNTLAVSTISRCLMAIRIWLV